VTRGTKSVIDFFTAPSFQEGRGSGACATALLQPSAEARIVTSAPRRLTFTSKASNIVSLRMELRKAFSGAESISAPAAIHRRRMRVDQWSTSMRFFILSMI
jgi:hypothetical protein